jgi:O-succinylbenzoate synthase
MSRYFIHEYQLEPEQALNACAAQSPRRGAWIRFQKDHSGWLFADCCPFPELGHPSLEDQLQSLKEGSPLPLLQSSLQLAAWEDSWNSHHNMGSYDLLSLSQHVTFSQKGRIQNASQKNVTVKLKMGGDLDSETHQWLKVAYENSHWRWRLDFNNSLSFDTWESWWGGVPVDIKSRVEFVEDPFVYDAQLWDQVQESRKVSLALDIQLDVDFASPGFDVIVFKPCWDFVRLDDLLHSKKPVVVTHSMESSWGHYQSVVFALDLKEKIKSRMLICGLLREGLFKNEPLGALVGWDPMIQGLKRFRSRDEAIKDLKALDWEPLS